MDRDATHSLNTHQKKKQIKIVIVNIRIFTKTFLSVLQKPLQCQNQGIKGRLVFFKPSFKECSKCVKKHNLRLKLKILYA